MRKIFLAILLLANFVGIAQKKNRVKQKEVVEKDTGFVICLAWPMTTHLVFNHPIEYADLGAAKEEAEARIAKEDQKVLEIILKSMDKPSFTKTNLTIKTNGKYYTYYVRYKKACNTNPFVYMNEDNGDAQAKVDDEKQQRKGSVSVEAKEVNNVVGKKGGNSYSSNTSKEKTFRVHHYDSTCTALLYWLEGGEEGFKSSNKEGKVQFRVSKCYVKDDKLYFVIKISNESSVGYDINSFNFSIDTKKKKKGKATQENELIPEFTDNSIMYVKGFDNELTKVFVLDKFTFDGSNKRLLIQVWEKNGDRNLKCTISQKSIINAEPF
jgi:Domain of unknown function (DUF4138)